MSPTPDLRVVSVNDVPVQTDGDYVLYWMTAFRRTGWNFSLQRAVEWAVKLQKPLVVLEAIRCDYPLACDRFHAVILNGMNDNRLGFEGKPVLYYPFVEERAGQGKGLVSALCIRACVVVTDAFPCLFLPRMLQAAADQCRVKLESVDSNGLMPLRAVDLVFTTAYSFRRFLQKNMIQYLQDFPEPDPLFRISLPMLSALPADILLKWPSASPNALAADPQILKSLPISHHPKPVPGFSGGQTAGRQVLKAFLSERFVAYNETRNHPDEDATSGLAPYLHFGHISSHNVVSDILKMENWAVDQLMKVPARGQRTGWWQLSDSAEAFFDQIITWRELGFNMCSQKPNDYDQFSSLPGWAQKELNQHTSDSRPHLYPAEVLENATTHDPLWNAAQIQLVREGRIHNYLRMLWGKKILEWSSCPQEALQTMIRLNNTYSLDGRDPNSYTGIFWTLGRYDRPWGPARPIFGKIRYMSSENTRRKLKLKTYLQRHLK